MCIVEQSVAVSLRLLRLSVMPRANEKSASFPPTKSIQTLNYRSTHHLRSALPPLLPRKNRAAAHHQCAQSGPKLAQGGSKWLKVAPGGSAAATLRLARPSLYPLADSAIAVPFFSTPQGLLPRPISHWLLRLIAWSLELGIWNFHSAPLPIGQWAIGNGQCADRKSTR